MKFFTILFLLMVMPLSMASADAFSEALALEKQGKHAEAAASYETMLTQHKPSSSVLFNLGNCYYASRNYGKAILAYERALLINPRANDVRKNLALAREAAFPSEAIVQPSGLWHLLSRSEWAMVITAAALGIAACAVVAAFSVKFRKNAIIIALLGLAPLVLSVIALTQRKGESMRAIVISPSCKLLLSPFAAANEIAPCAAGTMILVGESKNNFRYVTLLSGNSSGWLPESAIEFIEPARE